MSLKPRHRSLMRNVIRVKERNQDVDIKQSEH